MRSSSSSPRPPTAGVEFSYAEDIEPWLGEKAGFSELRKTRRAKTSFVAAVETTDEEQALESIQSLLAQGRPVTYEEGEYEGVTYFAAAG